MAYEPSPDPLLHLHNLLAQAESVVRELVRDGVLSNSSTDTLILAKMTISLDALKRKAD